MNPGYGGRAAAALVLAATAGIVAGAVADGSESFQPPARLSETGLYAEGVIGALDPRNLPYAPQYPLWTDGAAKARWIFLPGGSAIDASDDRAWGFPVGTKLWKEFSFGGWRVETRMLWRVSGERWIFAAYVWNDEQTEALLAPEGGLPGHVEIAPGKRHSIPSITDCAACHAAGPSVVLGFNALQLSDDRDPMAPHGEPRGPGMVTLEMLDEARLLDPARPDLVASPPRIHASTPRERAVLGYLSSNCGHCHNGSGPLARLGLVLAHDASAAPDAVAAAIATTVGAPGRYLVPGAPEGASRLLAPGDPDLSAVAYRMGSRRPSSQMPPLGTVTRDDEALALLRGWIAEDLHGAGPDLTASLRPQP